MSHPDTPKPDVVDRIPDDWSASAKTTAKNIAVVLTRHYPGWRWGVGVHEREGAIIIRNRDLPTDFIYFIRPADLDPEYRIVIKAGGELLEAFGIKRGRVRQDEHSALLASGFRLYPDHNAVRKGQPGSKAIARHSLGEQALSIVERAVLKASERLALAKNDG